MEIGVVPNCPQRTIGYSQFVTDQRASETRNCYSASNYMITTRQTYKEQESPADADKPARRGSMQKLLQFDVFRFISPNSISPNFKLPMHSFTRYVQAL